MSKLKIGVIYGGKSVEHEVSIWSAENIIKSLDKTKYEVVKILVKKDGRLPLAKVAKVDVVFPIIHGRYGEDGSLQGLLKILDKPFIGASVLGSAIGMDKEVMKRLLRDGGLNVGKFIVLKNDERISFADAKKKLRVPMFIKPANTGSSVGISKVKDKKSFDESLELAFQFDSKVLIEEFTPGQEIECSVLGNENPIASIPGEIVPNDEFYSYNAKYILEDGAALVIPAQLSKSITKKVQETAIKVFKALNCEGMGRVDMFVSKSGKVFVNEINTIPGFTGISMYPKLWEASGISVPKLLDRLIELALERFEKEQKLKSTYK